MTSVAELIIADSEKDANLYYATRFKAPDPFVYIALNGKKILLMSDLEVDRARAQARVDEVISGSQIAAELVRKGNPAPGPLDVIESVLREKNIKELVVPGNFPIEYADSLRERGFVLSVKKDPFFEERLIKTEEEAGWITQTQRAMEKAVAEAVEVIRTSSIRQELLYHADEVLTSERVKEIIHLALMREGCSAEHTIVACGLDGVDPHHEGDGPLKAHQPIIMDVFPRSSGTRYFADMTRTVVRGQASEKIKKMHKAVLEGQEIAFGMIRDGLDGFTIHQAILDYFESLGFKTGQMNGRFQGFFHGTGHGVGLDIHEPPRISQASHILRAGQVVTVEPGLYYLDAGGVRLEDMVVVTKTGCRNLTNFPKVLEY